MNENGGMDAMEFEKYIFGSIFILYPHERSIKGKWMIIKVDSGPGRLNQTLLYPLRNLVFIIYPSVPNTTAMTQETNRNYGPFKTQVRVNLNIVVRERIAKKVSVSMQPWLAGLVVFGSIGPETGYVVKKSSFEFGFSRASCKNAWAKIGAALLIMVCLTDSKVC